MDGHRTQLEAQSLEAAGLHTWHKLLPLLSPGALSCQQGGAEYLLAGLL